MNIHEVFFIIDFSLYECHPKTSDRCDKVVEFKKNELKMQFSWKKISSYKSFFWRRLRTFSIKLMWVIEVIDAKKQKIHQFDDVLRWELRLIEINRYSLFSLITMNNARLSSYATTRFPSINIYRYSIQWILFTSIVNSSGNPRISNI